MNYSMLRMRSSVSSKCNNELKWSIGCFLDVCSSCSSWREFEVFVHTYCTHSSTQKDTHHSQHHEAGSVICCVLHKKIVQYVPQSAGFLCPPNPLGNSSYCFRFRGRADWESLHCLMAWICDVPWHCQCDLPLTNVKTQPQILNVVPYSVGWFPIFSENCLVQFS